MHSSRILAAVRRSRRRWIVQRAAVRLGWTAIAGAATIAAALAADRFCVLPHAVRAASSALALGVPSALLAWSLASLARGPGAREVARRIEHGEPALAGGLLSSVELALASEKERARFSSDLVNALYEATSRKLSSIDVRRAFDPRPARKVIAGAVVAWTLLVSSFFTSPEASSQLFARLVHPLSDLPRPSSTRLEVSPGSTSIARGDDLTVRIQVVSGSPEAMTFWTRPAGGEWTPEEHALSSATVSTATVSRTFSALRRDLEYRLAAGDYSSPDYQVRVREPPRPTAFRITYTFPAYSERKPETVSRPSGDLSALAGALADVEVSADVPLREARIRVNERGPEIEGSLSGENALFRGLEVAHPGSYRLQLVASDGVTNSARVQFAIRPIPDRPPTVDLLEPRTTEISAEATSFVALRFDVRDDVGLKSLELGVAAPDGHESWSPLEPGTSTCALDVSGLGLRPGQSAKLVLRARDGLGQEGRSSERMLRVALVPEAPEGPGWPRPLLEIEASLQAALEDWAKLIPAADGEPPEDISPDPAFAERLADAAEKTLAIMNFLRRAAGLSLEAGRGIAVPSPNRKALEGLASSIARAANDDCAAFWSEASLVAGKVRDAGPGSNGSIPVSKLYRNHHDAGSHIEEALLDLRALLRSEEMEDLLELAAAIEHDLASGPGGATATPRTATLAPDLTQLAARLTSLASRSGNAGEDMSSAARTLVESAIPALERGVKDAVEAISSVRARILAWFDRDEKTAARVRERLVKAPHGEAELDRLAASTERSEALTWGRRAIAAVSEELERVEAMEYADLETSADLSTLRDLIERIAEEHVQAGGVHDASLAAESREIAAFYRAAAPSRAMGRIIQDIDRVASGEEDLAWRVRAATAWNWRTLRQLSRTQREILRALDGCRIDLRRVRQSAPASSTALLEGLGAVETALESASRAMAEAQGSLALEGDGADRPDNVLARAAQAAGRACGAIDGMTERLESLRALASPEAAEHRERLKARLGTVAERIDRLASSEKAHSGRVKALSLDASAIDFTARTETLALSHEDLRFDAETLASRARREGDRVTAEQGGMERLRAYDRAAVEIATLASNDMPLVTRALRAAGAQSTDSRAGTLFEASTRGGQIAERLGLMAKALGAAEADGLLQVTARDLEDALKALRQGPSGEEATDPARIERDARICLTAALKAAQSLARQAVADPRKLPLLELLRSAAELFRQAITLADARDTPAAAAALRFGRTRLEEASLLAKKLRGDAEAEAAGAREALGAEKGAENGNPGKKELARDVEATYAELEKLLELEKLGRELASSLEEILREASPDPQKVQELEKKERDLEEGLGDRYLTTAELVDLVSKLVAIDRDGRELSALERTLAAETERLLEAGRNGASLAPLKPRQAEALQRSRKVAKDFQTAGFKLSAVLPHVLKAYWQAGDAMEPVVSAVETATKEVEASAAAQGALLAAAASVDGFLGRVGEMRRLALEAIADQERGEGGPNAAQSSIERARRNLAEASRLRREGQAEASQRARQQSIRSIADASGALRSRVAELALPGAGEGLLMSRVLDEEAARLGLGWQVLTRGSSLPGAARLTRESSAEMPFPAQFREWVKVYLKAIEENRP